MSHQWSYARDLVTVLSDSSQTCITFNNNNNKIRWYCSRDLGPWIVKHLPCYRSYNKRKPYSTLMLRVIPKRSLWRLPILYAWVLPPAGHLDLWDNYIYYKCDIKKREECAPWHNYPSAKIVRVKSLYSCLPLKCVCVYTRHKREDKKSRLVDFAPLTIFSESNLIRSAFSSLL